MLLSVPAVAKQGVYRTWTAQFLLRLTPEQKQRLEAVCHRLGKKMTDFVRDCVVKTLDEIEEQHEQKKERRREEQREAFVPRNPNPPRGLGLRPRAPAPPPEPPPEPAPPTTTVVVQQSSATSVDHLAAYVLGAKNMIDREERERQVTKIVQGGAPTQEEAERVARALDEKLAAATPRKEPTGLHRWLTGG